MQSGFTLVYYKEGYGVKKAWKLISIDLVKQQKLLLCGLMDAINWKIQESGYWQKIREIYPWLLNYRAR